MSKPDERPTSLEEIDARLAEIRRRRAQPTTAPRQGRFAGSEMGWRMVMDLVAGIAVGAGMGWGLDSLFGSKPLFLILMILLGFAAGVRLTLHSAREFERRQDAAHAAGNDAGATAPRDEGR